VIEPLITRLVREAPVIDPDVVAELRLALERDGAPLARSISRVLELVGEQLVDPGIALPALAMATATLTAAIRGELGERELEAARYEIDTLIPVPDPPRAVVMPQVPVASLRRRGS